MDDKNVGQRPEADLLRGIGLRSAAVRAHPRVFHVVQLDGHKVRQNESQIGHEKETHTRACVCLCVCLSVCLYHQLVYLLFSGVPLEAVVKRGIKGSREMFSHHLGRGVDRWSRLSDLHAHAASTKIEVNYKHVLKIVKPQMQYNAYS